MSFLTSLTTKEFWKKNWWKVLVGVLVLLALFGCDDSTRVTSTTVNGHDNHYFEHHHHFKTDTLVDTEYVILEVDSCYTHNHGNSNENGHTHCRK